jgi:hypothetical protein
MIFWQTSIPQLGHMLSSALAHSKRDDGGENPFPPIDRCRMQTRMAGEKWVVGDDFEGMGIVRK